MTEKGKGGLYFGWYVVGTCFFLMALAYAPSTTLVGQFLVPVVDAFGVSNTAATLIVTVGMLAAVFASPVAGGLLTRFGTRKLVTVMLLISAGSNVGMGVAGNFLILNIFAALRGISLAFVGMVPIAMMVAAWFGRSRQGKAIALATIGSGIGAMAVSPLLAFIIEDYSWRWGFFLFALLSLLCVPLVLATFAPSPQVKGLQRLGDDPPAPQAAGEEPAPDGMSGSEALKSGKFWAILLGFLFVAGVCQTWVNNAPGFYNGKLGISLIMVGTLIAVTALVLTVGKLLLGAFCDKFGARLGFFVSVACLVLCYALGIIGEIGAIAGLAMVCAIVMGLGQASLNITMPLITGQICGSRAYGVCMGYLQAAAAIGSAFIPLGASALLDVTGNYSPAFVFAGALGLIAIILIFAAYARQR
ncbi:MAG: MFS transporter [Gracilibacteraceae bacterium]|jgi:MFS family permease|nr:MFS transporter [Gracilibacteraceae bacterium]